MNYSIWNNLIATIFLLLIPIGFVLHYYKYYEIGLISLIISFLGITFFPYIIKNHKKRKYNE